MLAAALLLDAVLGEPKALWSRVPHPVVLIGRAVGWLDQRLNLGTRRRIKGVLAICLLILIVLPLPALLVELPFGWVFEIVGAAVLLAHRSLIDHVRAVAIGLRTGLAEGRAAVAEIVGRDPESLDEAGIARAAIESAAENFSDGVVAPAFWFAIGGLPGIVLYKAVNTADSMIGYRTADYKDFGWAAARLDDLLNLVPARLTALLFLLTGGAAGNWQTVMRDAPRHRSVNAGWPEAAMAVGLGLALAGPRVYAGAAPVEDPYMNESGRDDAGADDIEASIRILWRAWWAVFGLALLFGIAAVL